jgi:hypothetical protein
MLLKKVDDVEMLRCCRVEDGEKRKSQKRERSLLFIGKVHSSP